MFGEDGCCSGSARQPSGSRWIDPRQHLDDHRDLLVQRVTQRCSVTAEEDRGFDQRFMVRDAIAKAVQHAEPTIDELTTSRCRPVRNAVECIVEDWDPQRLSYLALTR